MSQFSVRVRSEHRWNTVRVAGRMFAKQPTLLHASELGDEIRNSSVLEVLLTGDAPIGTDREHLVALPTDEPTGAYEVGITESSPQTESDPLLGVTPNANQVDESPIVESSAAPRPASKSSRKK